MPLPNFLVIGAAKAGTTAVYDYLKQHPQIYMSPLKETNFFALEGQEVRFRGLGDDGTINALSLTTLDAYLAQFGGVVHETAIGEASPLYLYSPRAADRIRHYIPDAKLIAILRNPVERAFSAFSHLVRDRREPLDFGRALDAEDVRVHQGWEHIWHYTRMGFYHAQLTRYYDLFARAQIKVYLYDRFDADSISVLQDIFRFLGVEDTFVPDVSCRPNVSRPPDPPLGQLGAPYPDGPTATRRPIMSPEIRRHLVELFRPDIVQLEELCGQDLSVWLDASSLPVEQAG